MPSFSTTESSVATNQCPQCHGEYTLIKDFVERDHAAFAICLTECHRHDTGVEIFITAIMNVGDEESKHVTFDCRYGVAGDDNKFACTLIDAPQFYKDPVFGRKLSRAEALEHPLLEEYWQLVDFILANEHNIHQCTAMIYQRKMRNQ